MTLEPTRIDELLAGRALNDLDHAEERELEGLLAQREDVDPTGFDSTVTTVMLSLLGPLDPLPRSLRDRLGEQGRETLRRRQA